MREAIPGLFGMLIIVLPQLAGARDFRATYEYPAKFVFGRMEPEAGLGAIVGHYNTIVNILASADDTRIALRATVVSTDLEISEGEPSAFVGWEGLDSGEAAGILCSDIKRDIFDARGQGFMDGFVVIYSSKPLTVTTVVTGTSGGDGGSGHSMQITPSRETRSKTRVVLSQ